MQIAIDGPAGAGKSTIARRVAREMGYIYIDTGAMYRTIGLYMLEQGIPVDDEQAVSSALANVRVEVGYQDGEQQLFLNGENVTGRIRTDAVSRAASAVSRYTAVREGLVEMQRKMAASTNVVMDGRDIGTVVLPRAEVKIYLTASVECRARRRFLEYQQKGGSDQTREDVMADVAARDEQDMNRAVSPLRQAQDAMLLDSTNLTIDEVVAEIKDFASRTAHYYGGNP